MIEKIAFRPYRGSTDKIEAEIVVTVAGKKIRRRKRVPDALTTPAAIRSVAKGKALSPSLPASRWAREQAEKLITEPSKKTSKASEPVVSKGLTFGAFVDQYLEAYWTSVRAKPATRARHLSALKLYHLPRWKDVKLADITKAGIARQQAELSQSVRGQRGGPAKASSINMIVMTLTALLRYAAELGYLEGMPLFRKLKTPRRKKKAPRYSDEELARLLDEAVHAGDPHTHLAILLGADMGLRRSEIVTLRHEDVDFVRMEITIKRGLSCEVEGETKGQNERSVPMTERVAEALRRHPRALNVPQVIWHHGQGNRPGKGPRRYTTTGIYRRISELQKSLRLPTGMHLLRHTYGSRLADRGASQATVAASLGHSRASTSDRYVHVSAEGVRGLLDRPAQRAGEDLEKSRR